jgi:hypothetical protein
LAAKVRAGLDYRQLHLEAHLRLGSVLKALGIVDMEPDAMLQHGVSSTFFPHGLGHPIGLQVHDVAGYSDVEGKLIPRPAGHPYLRMTRTLEPGMVVTIEPGIYFIPTLLEKLRADAKSAKSVDWGKVEHLSKFGGVRIEDEVHCTEAPGKPDPRRLRRNIGRSWSIPPGNPPHLTNFAGFGRIRGLLPNRVARPRAGRAVFEPLRMEKSYEPQTFETRLYAQWEASGAFKPSGKGQPYTIMLPPPNVTGTLHMGHAFQHTLQDALCASTACAASTRCGRWAPTTPASPPRWW